MWAAIAIGIIIVYNVIVDDDEEGTDSGSTDSGSSITNVKFGVGKWRATHEENGKRNIYEIELFQDKTAIVVNNGHRTEGSWSKESTSKYDVVYEWIEVKGYYGGSGLNRNDPSSTYEHYVDLNGNAYIPIGKYVYDCIREGKPDYRFTRIK